MARTPAFIREFIPYSTIKQNELKWSTYAGSRISYNRNLLAREFGVDPDRVYSIFARNFKKHTKDFPLAAVDTGTEKNKRDYEKQEQYVLFLWNYYVVDKPKKPSLPKKPKETTVQVPSVEDSYDEQEIDPDNPYAGDVDDPPMIAEMRRIKPPRGGALAKTKAPVSKTYSKDGPSRNDLLGDDTIDPRIAELLGLEDGFDFTYDEYLTILKEWQMASRMTDSKVSTEDSMLIDAERKRVRGKTGKFRVNVKSVNKPTTKPATRPTKGMLGGAPEQPQLLLAPGEDDKKKRKRKASLEENVAAIRKSVDKIFKALNGQFEAIKKQAELDRLNKQRERRKKRENALEGAGKFVMKQARKLAAPTFDLLDRLFKFIGTVILGRVLFKIVEWMADKENQDKIKALGQFLKDWWPVLLSAFVLFATPLGGLIRTVLAGVVKLSMFMAKKAIPGLLKFAKAHPLAAAAVGVGALGLTAVAANQDGTAVVKDPEKPDKSQMDEINEFGGMTGAPISGDMLGFKGGGQVPRYAKGGNVQRNKRTMPSGGKVSQSTGKRVKGAGKDTQMIVAQPGEIVMSKPAVDKVGAPFLLNLNKMGGGTNQPQFTKFGDLQFAQGGGVVGAKDIDMEKVMQTLRDAYITPDDLGPAGIDNPRIQNVANYLYGIEKLNSEGLDEFQVMDLQAAKKSYPKMDRNRRRKNPFASKGETQDKKEKKPKAKPRPMGRSAAKKRMEAKKKEEEGGMEAPSAKNKVAPAAAAAVITGAMPQTAQTAPAATAKPAPAMLGKGNLPPVPEPPQPKVNVMTAKTGSPPPSGGSGGGSGGYRDVPTSFDAFYQTDLRMQMLAIYGITEVE
jgi:hypothetical protein